MNYLTISIFESKLVPGLKFKLRKMSHGRRMEFNLGGAEIFAKLREAERELEPVQEEIQRAKGAARIEPCICGDSHAHTPSKKVIPADGDTPAREEDGDDPKTPCIAPNCHCREPKPENKAFERQLELLKKHQAIFVDEFNPYRIRWAVAEITGLEIDGEPTTINSFLREMPDAVIKEVADAIDDVMKLTLDEQLGFKSPTTSGAPVDGKSLNSSAPTAEDKNSTTLSAVAA